MEEGISRMYERLRALQSVGNVDAPHIQVQIADVLRDLKANGQSDEDSIARTDPRRFDAGFDPKAVATAVADPSSE